MNVIQKLLKLAITEHGGYGVAPEDINGVSFYIDGDQFTVFIKSDGALVFRRGIYSASNDTCLTVTKKSIELEAWFNKCLGVEDA